MGVELTGSGSLLAREFFDRPAPEVAPDLLGCVICHETAEGLVAVEIAEAEAYSGASDPASHAFRGRTARNAVMFGPPGHAYVYFTYGMHFCVNLVCQGDGDASAVLLRAGRVIEGAELATARRYGGRSTATGSTATGSTATGSTATGSTATGSTATGSTAAGPTARGGAATGGAVVAGSWVVAGSTVAAGSAAVPGGTAVTGPRQLRTVREIDLARGPARLCQALAIDRAQDGADVCDPASPLQVHAAANPGARAAADVSRGPRVGVSRAAEVAWRFWITGEQAVSPYRASAPRSARAKPVSGQGREDGTMPR